MIRLSPPRSRTPFPTSAMASLAILLLSTVVVAGLFAAARGPGLRFATGAEASEFAESSALRVRILPGGDGEVDGVPVPRARLAGEVGARLRGATAPAALLVVSPDATYGEMVEAYAAIASVPRVRVTIPTRAWVEASGTP